MKGQIRFRFTVSPTLRTVAIQKCSVNVKRDEGVQQGLCLDLLAYGIIEGKKAIWQASFYGLSVRKVLDSSHLLYISLTCYVCMYIVNALTMVGFSED